MSQNDPRRSIGLTDVLLANPLRAAATTPSGPIGCAAVTAAQGRVCRGEIAPGQVAEAALAALPAGTSSLAPLVSATGVVVHTNVGRASASFPAVEVPVDDAGYVDVEVGPNSAELGRRGEGAHEVVPAGEDALVANNGVGALLPTVSALALGREVVVSCGEMIEIGDAFRLPDLIASTRARLHEVGRTNRTHPRDYTDAVAAGAAACSRCTRATSGTRGSSPPWTCPRFATCSRSDGSRVPVVVDIESGLLASDPVLPPEPDTAMALRDGAPVVLAREDKLAGGPQTRVLFGERGTVRRLWRQPLARARRVDELTHAALEATVWVALTPVRDTLRRTSEELLPPVERLATGGARGGVRVDGRVGGGGAPGVQRPSWEVEVPGEAVERPRRPATGGVPVVLACVEGRRGLVELHCIPPDREADLLRASRGVLGASGA